MNGSHPREMKIASNVSSYSFLIFFLIFSQDTLVLYAKKLKALLQEYLMINFYKSYGAMDFRKGLELHKNT